MQTSKFIKEFTKVAGSEAMFNFIKLIKSNIRFEELCNNEKTLHEILTSAFVWADSPQGHHYWSEFYYKCQSPKNKKA